MTKPKKDVGLIVWTFSRKKNSYKLLPTLSFIFCCFNLLTSPITLLHFIPCFSCFCGPSCLPPSLLQIPQHCLFCNFLFFFLYIFSTSHQLHSTGFFFLHRPPPGTYYLSSSLRSFLKSAWDRCCCRSHLTFAFPFYRKMRHTLIKYIVNNSGDEKGENTAWQTAEIIQWQGKCLENF